MDAIDSIDIDRSRRWQPSRNIGFRTNPARTNLNRHEREGTAYGNKGASNKCRRAHLWDIRRDRRGPRGGARVLSRGWRIRDDRQVHLRLRHGIQRRDLWEIPTIRVARASESDAGPRIWASGRASLGNSRR